ncbi:uncharacterized protein O3C94_004686 [Discoglossus pictus]
MSKKNRKTMQPFQKPPPSLPFKQRKSFETRKEDAIRIKKRFPTKIPVIVERYEREKYLPLLNKTKFLVPQDFSMIQFINTIRTRMNLSATHALYLLVNNKSLASMSLTVAELYMDEKDEDGFLYMTYASQEMFVKSKQLNTLSQQKPPKMKPFKQRYSLEERKADALGIQAKFPQRIPLIVERYQREKYLPPLNKTKFLVPPDISVAQLINTIRNRMDLSASQAFYLLVNKKSLPCMSITVSELYRDFKDEDGFLYMTYASQEMFG